MLRLLLLLLYQVLSIPKIDVRNSSSIRYVKWNVPYADAAPLRTFLSLITRSFFPIFASRQKKTGEKTPVFYFLIEITNTKQYNVNNVETMQVKRSQNKIPLRFDFFIRSSKILVIIFGINLRYVLISLVRCSKILTKNHLIFNLY